MVDTSYENGFTRYINQKDTRLVWHRDKRDRIVILMDGECYIQLDNQVPIKMTNEPVFIPKGLYHRIISENEDLTFFIEELD